MDAVTFSAVFISLYVGHSVGDHWVQTQHQAINKGKFGREGQLACLRHVATLTATKLAALSLVWWTVGFEVDPLWMVAGLLLDVLSHYWADRRLPLVKLAKALGKIEFYHLGSDTQHQFNPSGSHLGTGKYALDQSFHHFFLLVAAVVSTLG